VSTVSAVVPNDDVRPWSPGARGGVWAAAALALLALVEAAQALLSPLRAPVAADWSAAADAMRAAFRPGDLIVPAPGWADPVMRMHVGDLLPIPVAARMDDARFGRVWVFSQRGAHASEEAHRAQVFERKFGAITLRRFEGRPAEVTMDFLERWKDAYVTHWNPAARVTTPCPWKGDGFVCPTTGNSVRRELVEVDQKIKSALLAPPVAGGIVAVEFQSAVLGRELVVAAGLHDTWARKSPGAVYLEVWIAGQPARGALIDNRSGWRELRIDTSTRDGQTVPVRFQVSSPQPVLRHLAFAAEARR
jgi:hypothetical protein